MSNVIEIKWYQEQRRREKERAREALRELLTGSPSVAPASGVAPAPGKVVVIPGKSDDPDELENFNRGFAAGFEASRYNPKSTGAGYGCGYFGGITAREYRNQMVQDGRQPPSGEDAQGPTLSGIHPYPRCLHGPRHDGLDRPPRHYGQDHRRDNGSIWRERKHGTAGFDSDKFDFSGWSWLPEL